MNALGPVEMSETSKSLLTTESPIPDTFLPPLQQVYFSRDWKTQSSLNHLLVSNLFYTKCFTHCDLALNLVVGQDMALHQGDFLCVQIRCTRAKPSQLNPTKFTQPNLIHINSTEIHLPVNTTQPSLTNNTTQSSST